MNSAKVSIIIVNFNCGELLTDCVRSALASTVPVEVFVSDNGSTDGSVEYLRQEIVDDRLHINLNNKNLGFATASNVPLAKATGDYLIFLNPDCIVKPETIELMVAQMQKHPEAGMAGPLILNPDGSEQSGCRRRVPTPARSLVRMLHLEKPFPFLEEKGMLLHKMPLPESPTEAEAISGAFMMVTRNALDEVGPLDEGYFLHCEDLDWCMRFRGRGWKILFVPDVEVMHAKGSCSGGRPVRVEWHKHRGMVHFYRKFFRHQYPSILLWMVISAVWFRFVVLAVVISFKRVFTINGKQETGGSCDIRIEPADLSSPQVAASKGRVLVTGATSMIGDYLMPLLVESGYEVVATSRKPKVSQNGICWVTADMLENNWHEKVSHADIWINLASLKFVPQNLESVVKGLGIRRVIAFSSTSRFTKVDARGAQDRGLAASLAENENEIKELSLSLGISWTIFRPTLIYSLGRDKNISFIYQKIRQLHFFPLVGSGNGLRQPVHAEDLAMACVQAMQTESSKNSCYNLSGAEILPYRDMVKRLFEHQKMKARFIHIPLFLFRLAILLLKLIPRYRDLTPDMADRMVKDMVFSHDAAARDFGYSPRGFTVEGIDD